MNRSDQRATRFAAIAIGLLPFLIHPVLVLVDRRVEKGWPWLAGPEITPTIDIALPIIAAVVAFALMSRMLQRRVLLTGLIYIPVMSAMVLYASAFLFNYAWRDSP